MKRLTNTYRITRYWWKEFRWYRRTPERTGGHISSMNAARRAWSATQHDMYHDKDGEVGFLPF